MGRGGIKHKTKEKIKEKYAQVTKSEAEMRSIASIMMVKYKQLTVVSETVTTVLVYEGAG